MPTSALGLLHHAQLFLSPADQLSDFSEHTSIQHGRSCPLPPFLGQIQQIVRLELFFNRSKDVQGSCALEAIEFATWLRAEWVYLEISLPLIVSTVTVAIGILSKFDGSVIVFSLALLK